MNLLFNLVWKDFVLAKKHLLLMLVLAVAFPIFIQVKITIMDASFLSFFITALYVQFMLFNTVSMQEDKFKGSNYLSATPYTRKALVTSKYIFLIVLFLSSTIVYMITSIAVPTIVPIPSISIIGKAFLVITVYYGIYIPIQYQFGYDKTKYLSMGYIIISMYIFPFGIKFMQAHNIKFHSIFLFDQFIPFFLALVIGAISMRISTYIYTCKDL